MDFIDRDAEMTRLDRLERSRDGGLAVVVGRRRVGKTRLLLEWVRAHGGVYWVADESAASIQRRNLAETLAARLPGFAEVEYRDWATLFSRIGREAKQAGWRGPLVIDEVPYLVGAAPELASVLQNFVDHGAKEARLVLAIAGSSQRMMQGLVLSADAPVYGRAREILRLSPLPPGHIVDALAGGEPAKGAELWAAWGGIPRYWELAEGYDDVHTAVEALVLDRLGPLHDEPARLLLEEVPPAVTLRPILDAIGAGAHRVSEIGGRIGQPATSLARPLSRLQELELVAREVPFGETERSSRRALYKLADPFTRLWFSLVAPKRSVLIQADRAARLRLFDEVWPRLRSIAWEDLCRRAAPALIAARLGTAFGPAGRFWAGGGPEWDVLAGSLDGAHRLVGEAKWPAATPSAADVARLAHGFVAKGAPPSGLGPGAVVHHALFLPRKPETRPKSQAAHVHVFDAADVLAALR